MPKPIDITGKQFDRLTVMGFSHCEQVGGQSKRFWRCQCACGNVVTRAYGALSTGNTRSCGCLLVDSITTHGGYQSPVYKVWHAMIERCRNPNDQSFADYGGRGIKVCDRWLQFAAFRDDMGPRPEGGTLERVDVNGSYERTNCRWATAKEQARNRRNNRLVTYAMRTQPLSAWAEEAGISKSCLMHRLNAGWPIGEALVKPPNRKQRYE